MRPVLLRGRRVDHDVSEQRERQSHRKKVRSERHHLPGGSSYRISSDTLVVLRDHELGEGRPPLRVPGELVEARAPWREQHHVPGKGYLACLDHRRGKVRNQTDLRRYLVLL